MKYRTSLKQNDSQMIIIDYHLASGNMVTKIRTRYPSAITILQDSISFNTYMKQILFNGIYKMDHR